MTGTRFSMAGGLRIAIDGPDRAPWIVFSNSLATNLTMWDAQVSMLQESFRILRYDQRGHGGTQATKGAYTLELLADDLNALLQHVG